MAETSPEQRQERLNYVVMTYGKEMAPLWETYVNRCEKANIEPRQFLSDASLYDGFIGTSNEISLSF